MLVCIGISFSSFFQKKFEKSLNFFLGSYLWLAAGWRPNSENTKNVNSEMNMMPKVKLVEGKRERGPFFWRFRYTCDVLLA